MSTRAALAVRRVMLRTARSPLRRVWGACYLGVARLVASVVAPRRSRTSVFIAGSVASGEPIYGLSDIDLVAVAPDDRRARQVRRRFDALCRVVPPLRGLISHFWTYEAADLAAALAGPYPVNGLASGRAVFLGDEAIRDEMGLLERPGLAAGPAWRRLRGTGTPTRPPAPQQRLVDAWLEVQFRWRYVFRAAGHASGLHGPALAVRLVSEAARIWLWLVTGERHEGRRAPLERALELMESEREGFLLALDVERRLHRSPTVRVDDLLASFVRMTSAIAERVDAEAFEAGATLVDLLGADGEAADVPLLDWRALAFPEVDWARPQLPTVVEERLVPVADDPADPPALARAAARVEVGRAPAMRRGALLVEPNFDVWGWGRLRMVQCAASDPVSTALLAGLSRAAFPRTPGWSPRDWAACAVAEHRAWLWWGRGDVARHAKWIGGRPSSVWATPATLGGLFAAARAALFLDSVEEGRPELPLTFAATVAALSERDAGVGADAAEAYAALDESVRSERPPPPEIVGHFRRQVEWLPEYAMRTHVPRPVVVERPSGDGGGGPAHGDGDRFTVRRGTNVSQWLSQGWQVTLRERVDGFSRDDALRIRELGLDHVRLPVDEDVLWHADRRLDRRGVELLREGIEWCREAGLRVIVDLHAVRLHRLLHPAPTLFGHPDGGDVLAGLWADLSEALGDLPLDAVAYELLNEPTAPTDDRWNDVAARAIAAIRAREPHRTIVLASNRYSHPATVAALRVPDDPRLILGFHYYEPMLVTHYRVPWNARLSSYTGPIAYPGTPIPESDLARLEPAVREMLEPMNRHYDRERIRADLAAPLAVAARTGHPLHCGELGVFETVADELRLRWYRDVIDVLEESGIGWATWTLRGRFGLYNGNGPTVVHRAIAERRFSREGGALG